MNWHNFLQNLSGLFEQGGMTLWAILFTSSLLWLLIIERYWYLYTQYPQLRNQLTENWKTGSTTISHRQRMRRLQASVETADGELSRNIQTLQALTGLLPLLGLLGTVSGMIKVFDVITMFGSGNTRGMAAGISEALITTMAGLFTALSGIYFVSDLEQRCDDSKRELETSLIDYQNNQQSSR